MLKRIMVTIRTADALASRRGPTPRTSLGVAPPFTPTRVGQKSHRVTPEPPYNPHRFAAHSHAASSNRVCPHGAALVHTPIVVAVRMKPYSGLTSIRPRPHYCWRLKAPNLCRMSSALTR